jgi:GNAT acetyltransferase-like protein
LEDYIFHEGLIPSGYRLEFEQAIFNQPVHLTLQAPEGWHSFYVLNKKKKKVSAAIHFYIDRGIAKSPLRNPFGSFEYAESLRPIVLFLFIEFVEAQLIAKGVARLIIKTPPQAYHHEQTALLYTFLLNNNYRVSNAEIASGIEVSGNLQNKLHRSQKRKLEKAKRARLVFKEVAIEQLDTIYTFIENCRHQKDYKLSLSLAELHRTVKVCKGHYKLFAVYQKKQLAAASITIRVKQNILYDFYHDHALEFDQLSPVVLLVEGIYKFCLKHKITFLDLGTSAVEGTPNFPLLNFKMKLGAKPSTKLTFEKVLS